MESYLRLNLQIRMSGMPLALEAQCIGVCQSTECFYLHGRQGGVVPRLCG